MRGLLVPAVLVVLAGACVGDDGDTGGGGPGTAAVDTARTVGELTPFETWKAETLLRDRLSCLGCHTLDGEGGRIGPDLSRVGDRLSAQGIRSMITDPEGTRPGAIMPRELMPDHWLDLVVRYLAARSTGEPWMGERDRLGPTAAPPEVIRAENPDGEVLYRTYCAVCHGARGGGDGPNARFLPVAPTAHGDPEYMSRRPDASLFDAVWAGGRVMNRSHRMPPFGQILSRNEVWALVDYMRGLCDCRGPRWSRDDRSLP